MDILKQIVIGLIWGIFINTHFLNAQTQNKTQFQRLDPSIRYGSLPNGFRYYIKHIGKPHEKLNMRLYVKVGSDHTNADQLDFAHAMEHMAFKSAKHFPKNLLHDKSLINSLGMERYDIFGQTGYGFTSYYFDVPLNRKDAMDKGLLWFHDIATDLKLNKTQIDDERGPLRQELIYRQGDDLNGKYLESKLKSLLFPCRKDYTDFFEHNKTFKVESLMQFYKDWYRPDLMGLVIVGNIDNINELELEIRKRFSDIKISGSSKKWTDCKTEYLQGPNQFVTLKREQGIIKKQKEVEVFMYMKDMETIKPPNAWDGLKRAIIWPILNEMLRDRFKETIQSQDTLYSIGSNFPKQTFPSFRIKIRTKGNYEREALTKAVQVVQQIKKHGFTGEEWEQAKIGFLKEMQSKGDTTQTEYWVEQIRNYFVYGEALPKHKGTYLNQWLANLSLKSFNRLVKEYISVDPDDIAIIAPTEHMALSYTETEIRQWIHKAQKIPVKPYTRSEIPTQLMANEELAALKEVGYVDRGEREFGAKELMLNNGVKVVLHSYKPSSGWFHKRIMLHGFSPKGASCFPKEDYFSAINAPYIIKNAGLGKMDRLMLNKYLDRTSFKQGIHPYVEYNETGIKGDVVLKDLEKMLQLIYLYYTNSHRDKVAFNNWKRDERKNYLSPTYGLIQEDFNVAIRDFFGDNTVKPRGTKRFKGIQNTNMDRAYDIYKKLYGNASDFTFIIGGDFPLDTVIPLLQKYLGNLPTTSNSYLCSSEKQIDIKLSKDPTFKEFLAQDIGGNYDMKSVKYSVKYISRTSNMMDWKENIKVQFLGLLINSKIQELRTSMNASLYQMAASGKFDQHFRGYVIEMLMDCVPEEVEAIRKLCQEIIMEIKSKPFSKDTFEEVFGRSLYPLHSKVNGKKNMQMMQKLYEFYRNGRPWIDSSEIEHYVRSLTLKDIQETAQKYLKDKNRVEFFLK